MLEVTSASYDGGYRLRLTSSDGASGIVVLEEALWGPVFQPLLDTERFQEFELSPSLHTICWGRDADLAPEYLRERLVTQPAATT